VRKMCVEQVQQAVKMIVGRDVEWDACRSVLEGHSRDVNAVVFSPDGQLIASASSDKTVRVWETATGQCRSVLEGHSEEVSAVVFSPDGQLVTSASSDSTVRVWETATGQCRSVLEGHSQAVRAVVSSLEHQTLRTDRGDISLPLVFLAVPPILPTQESSYAVTQGQWILRQERRFLWLPPEYRNCTMAVCRYMVCLGCNSGRVALLSFL
jgi:hypothetical protein